MVMVENVLEENNTLVMYEREAIELDSPLARLSFDADFMNFKDEVKFNIGPAHKMYFRLDHFTGNRAGLFVYSTKEAGGSARFSDFVLEQTEKV